MKYCTVCNTKYEDSVSFCALDGEVLEDDPSTLVNTTLDGQYHIEAMLGKGGMGAVYRARHILLGDRVAIKVLPPEMRNNAEWLRRFRREGQAARRFRHPNAVTVYDLRTTSDGLIYMVMEYVEGHTLDAELKSHGRFSPSEAFSTLEPVMSVLDAAHQMGVVHRDLKPENIMIGKPDEHNRPMTKLLDLGIAKMREVADGGGAATALTIAGQILGTPYYMSPEQWGEVPRDGNSEVDGRADIYSLGAVFYELVAGRRPFCSLTLQELRREHVAVAPRALHEFTSNVPEAFSRAIARAMSKDRGDRQSTAGELAGELRAALKLAAADSFSETIAAVGGSAQASSATSPPDTSAPGESSRTDNIAHATPQTMGEMGARPTNSDLNAPTIVTMESPGLSSDGDATSSSITLVPDQSSLGAAPQPSQFASDSSSVGAPQAEPLMETMATNPSAQPSGAYVQPALQSPSALTAAARRSPVVPLMAAALGVLLLVGTIGGWFVWRRMSGRQEESRTGGTTDVANNVGAGAETANAGEEIVRYWLEINRAQNSNEAARVAGVVPLASGQSFKFHFTPREDGYLYIVGPGKGNVPTTFLTAKPVPASGVKTNQVKGGADYSFPSGGGNWVTLDKNPGTEDFTIIFSKQPLTSLSFLNTRAGHSLSEVEQRELNDFQNQYKANAPRTDVIDGNGINPFVSVKTTPVRAPGEPAIFDVRIEHK